MGVWVVGVKQVGCALLQVLDDNSNRCSSIA